MPRLNVCYFLVPYTTLLLLLTSNVLGLTVNRTTTHIYRTSVSVVTLPMELATEADMKMTTMPTILGTLNAIDSATFNSNHSHMNRTTSSPQTIPTSSPEEQVHRPKANVS